MLRTDPHHRPTLTRTQAGLRPKKSSRLGKKIEEQKLTLQYHGAKRGGAEKNTAAASLKKCKLISREGCAGRKERQCVLGKQELQITSAVPNRDAFDFILEL